jgi:hypothetical protein
LIRIYESLIIPGLLQVEGYARLITQITAPNLDGQALARHVELRMARQAILTGDDATPLWVVLDEAALRHLVGMPEIRMSQLQKLAQIAETSNVTIQILTYHAGPHAGMVSPFMILGFHDPADPDLVYIESPTGQIYLDSGDQVRRYEMLFEHLKDSALGPDESTAFLAHLMKE